MIVLLGAAASAADVTFIGTNGAAWSVTNSWSDGAVPDAFDTAVITNGSIVNFDYGTGWPANNAAAVNLDGTVTTANPVRSWATVWNFGSTSILDMGANWLMLGGGGSAFIFDSGATFSNMTGTLELGDNSDITLGFNLASDGFDMLSTGTLKISGYAGQTILVDMAAYTGPTQNIPLIEFTHVGGSPTVTNAQFQTLNLVVTNNSGYPASLLWDEEEDTIVLDMGVIDYDVTWDGEAGDGLWSNATNWTGDTLPANHDVIGIHGAAVDATAQQYLPYQSTIHLTGASTLTGTLVRASGSTFYIGSQAALAGGTWDFDNGTVVVDDGASATMTTWEFKNDNSVTFNLSASGFTALTPGNLNGDSSINSNDTFIVDMADFAGPAQNIPLMDFSYGGTLTDAQFQTANLIVTNDSGYGATLVWDDATDRIILDMGVVEYDVTWDGEAGDGLWSNATNWTGNTLPAAGDMIRIDGSNVSWDVLDASGNLPASCELHLTGVATLNLAATLRANGSTVYVGSSASLTGSSAFVMESGNFIFEAGSTVNLSGNCFMATGADLNFNLNAGGFTTLQAGNLFLTSTANISNSTFVVDMADFSGPAQNIPLIDFGSSAEGGSLTDAEFQTANLSVINDSGYGATLVWDEVSDRIILDMGAITYDVSWDGEAGDGLWSNATNWTGDTLPANHDVIGIHGAAVDATAQQYLPYQSTIHLTGASTLTGALVRASGSIFYIGSQVALTGGTWDFDNGSLVFEDGASTTMSVWEFKNYNSVTFNLSASGFTTLTPGNLSGDASINSNDTFIVDMADFAGPAQNIILMDFSTGGSLTDTQFQTANLIVINDSGYGATLVWDDAADRIILDMGAVDYDVIWDGDAGDGLWSNATNWTGDTLPANYDVIGIDGATVEAVEYMPLQSTIYLTGASTLTGGLVRAQASTFLVGSQAALAGNWWDFDNASAVFDAGASTTMSTWQFNNANRLTFNLNSAGFATLTPGNLHGSETISSNDTFIVDMAEYTGGDQIITLVDFSNGGSLTDTQFQTADLVVTNKGSYTTIFEWDDATDSIVLEVYEGDPAPVADDQTVYLTDSNVVITLTADDPDNDPLTWDIVQDPAYGTLSGTAPNLTYTPTGAAVADSFTFTAHDGTSLSNTGTVTILPTVQFTESATAPSTDVLVSVLPTGPGKNPEGPLLWSYAEAGLGQSFSFDSDATLSAITVQKHLDATFDSDVHVLKLWIGEYDTDDSTNESYVASGASHTIGATLHTQYIDLSAQSFASNNYYTITLSSDISLTAGVEYGFQMAFTAQDDDNRFDIIKFYDNSTEPPSGEGIYDDGMTLYAANISGAVPFISVIDQPWNDLAFVLQGSSEGGLDPIGDITSGGIVDGKLLFSWDTSNGQTYNVMTNADLMTTNWGVDQIIVGDGGTVTVTNTPDLPQLFYKVTSP